MAVVPLTNEFLEQKYRASGRQYFSYMWQLENYDDVVLQIFVPPSLRTLAIDNSIMVTDIEIAHLGTVGVVLNPIYANIPFDFYFPAHTTTLATDVHYISNLSWVLKPVLGGSLLIIYPAGYAATDDILIKMTGYAEKELLSGLQPISVEGYKWPLTRR